MADHLEPDLNSDGQSYLQRGVVLEDWWIVKSSEEFNGKHFCVAGFESGSANTRAMRLFTSSPIIKVVDIFYIQASDGICITLRGLLNQERALKSGFSPELFEEIVYGLPDDWENFCYNCFRGVPIGTDINNGSSISEKGCFGQPKGKRKRRFWTANEDEMLKEGVKIFGAKSNKNMPWWKVLKKGEKVFHKTRTPRDLKDRWRNMSKMTSSAQVITKVTESKTGRDFSFLDKDKRRRLLWTAKEEEMLKEGVKKFAKENKNIPWRKVLEMGKNVFPETRSPEELKDKWRNMGKRS